VAGLVADGRQLVKRGQAEAHNYRSFYGDSIPAKVLSERLSSFVQVYTLYGSVRPFGCSVLLASVDKRGPQLYMTDPSGTSWVLFFSQLKNQGLNSFNFSSSVGLFWLCCRQRKQSRQD